MICVLCMMSVYGTYVLYVNNVCMCVMYVCMYVCVCNACKVWYVCMYVCMYGTVCKVCMICVSVCNVRNVCILYAFYIM